MEFGHKFACDESLGAEPVPARLSTQRICAEFRRVYRSKARLSPELMTLALAYAAQARESGGLSPDDEQTFKRLALRYSRGEGSRSVLKHKIAKPGLRFVREWQGKVHEVLALETGDFAYRGRSYGSLSLIAREITGAHWSGPRFFGLKRRSAEKAHD